MRLETKLEVNLEANFLLEIEVLVPRVLIRFVERVSVSYATRTPVPSSEEASFEDRGVHRAWWVFEQAELKIEEE